MNEQDLFKLKERIDDAKSKVSELEGQRKHLMKELKEQWSCTSVEAAEKKVKTMEKEISTLTINFDKGTEELEEKCDL